MVVSLHEMCIKILIENIEGVYTWLLCIKWHFMTFYDINLNYIIFCILSALFDTGGVPFDILEPVLAK